MIPVELAHQQAGAVEHVIKAEGLVISRDIRTMALRLLRNPAINSDALLGAYDALIELSQIAAQDCLHSVAHGYRRLGELLAEQAPTRVT
ncbi:conserved protein of unknown function [Rhodovastum atsumiense]|uniref:Uncharacterized protein n=1 Tax=Rhodovastum atsumiense TaxID=504468 RepID=A0A5M6IPI3_9PROT|nr:hypothetical protein [Rhodovastum atsumiense]KAA5609809.1 hypothetical protein F1189_22215 [Rhodovastum atsumiense]CAH2603714.1 conserved protein of unknown function [Rhodovastum atsumiense]